MSMDLWKECRELCKIARELCYSDKVILRLKQAKSICEMDRIMNMARHGLI